MARWAMVVGAAFWRTVAREAAREAVRGLSAGLLSSAFDLRSDVDGCAPCAVTSEAVDYEKLVALCRSADDRGLFLLILSLSVAVVSFGLGWLGGRRGRQDVRRVAPPRRGRGALVDEAAW